MPQRLLTPSERFAARVVTGPVAHLYAGLLDWLVLLTRWGWARLRGRELT